MKRLLCKAICWVFFAASLQAGLIVPAGYDVFVTPNNGQTQAGLALPADFFGPGSDPFAGTVVFRGNPPLPVLPPAPGLFVPMPDTETGLLIQHGVIPLPIGGNPADADTVVQRLNHAILPPGGSDTIPIEIVSLSLVSASPITVTYNHGSSQSFFDVFVQLDPSVLQLQGQMTLNRTGSTNGGTFTSELPVQALLTFQNVNPLGPQAFGPLPVQDLLSADGNWVFLPEPATVLMAGAGLTLLLLRRRVR